MKRQHSLGITVTFTLSSQVLFTSKSRGYMVTVLLTCKVFYSQNLMTVAYLCTSSTPDSCVYTSSLTLEPYLLTFLRTCTNIEVHETVEESDSKKSSTTQLCLPAILYVTQLRTSTCSAVHTVYAHYDPVPDQTYRVNDLYHNKLATTLL